VAIGNETYPKRWSEGRGRTQRPAEPGAYGGGVRGSHPLRDPELERTQVVPVPLGEAFAFFANPWNLEQITPPWLGFEILEAPRELRRGSLLRYRLRLFGLPLVWLTEITDWRPPRGFTDTQLAGPYRLWEHTHRLAAVADGTEIYDHVRYRLPGGPLAPLARRAAVARWLDEIFAFRAERLAELLGADPRPARGGPDSPQQGSDPLTWP
jgi:hypothetical protein